MAEPAPKVAGPKIPGPDHPITITPSLDRVTVKLAGETVAETTRALTLKEARYPAVEYIPRADAKMAMLIPTAHKTHCPYKGDASYFSIKVGDKIVENAVWSYERPYPAMKEIAGHLAFYPNKVDAIEVKKNTAI
ncbi:MAG TPA: DUF427 domain-containing protein [Candidatus Cybelea sp.]|nr:DUF427 domain-containing protein [Candidatus Cybelea sp.]